MTRRIRCSLLRQLLGDRHHLLNDDYWVGTRHTDELRFPACSGPAADCPLLSGRSLKLPVWLSILTFDAEPGEFYNSVHEQTVFDIEAGKLNGLAFDNSVIN
jgi:hypothetical protein